MHELRLANLLGAVSLAVSDRMLAEVRRTAGVSVSAASALVVLAHQPGLAVTELGRRVGLSQPAAARMVDSLEAAGQARREPGEGRTVRVALTSAGRRTAAKLLAARSADLARVLADFDDEDRAVLGAVLERLLARLYSDVGSSDLLCRLCDRACCTEDAVCPVGQAERDRSGRGAGGR